RGEEHPGARGARGAERVGHGGNRLVPGERARRPALAELRALKPGGRVDVAEAVAPLVADPPVVHVWVEARLQPDDPAALRMVDALRVGVDLDVAAARAPRADRLRAIQVPDASLEAKIAVGQRADWADVDDVAGVGVVERGSREQAELRVVAPVEDPELAGLRDGVAEAHAARAQDAAL